MFTGIIEEAGHRPGPGPSHAHPMPPGAGRYQGRRQHCCERRLPDRRLDIQPDGFWCDLSPETLARTNLGALHEGSLVNLERAGRSGRPVERPHRARSRGWHGRVPGAGPACRTAIGGSKSGYRPHLDRYVIHKGSITLDGVSLTVASLERDVVGVAIIPHTYEHTVMRSYGPGQRSTSKWT